MLVDKQNESLDVRIEVSQRVALAPRSVVVALVHNIQSKQVPVVDVTRENTFCVCVCIRMYGGKNDLGKNKNEFIFQKSLLSLPSFLPPCLSQHSPQPHMTVASEYFSGSYHNRLTPLAGSSMCMSSKIKMPFSAAASKRRSMISQLVNL
jgi:hypothetical protein